MKKRTSTYLLRLPLSLKAAAACFGETEANRRSPMIVRHVLAVVGGRNLPEVF